MRNKFEERISDELSRAKIKFKYENKKIPYILARHYTNDFDVYEKKFLIETKGYLRPEDKAKLVAVKKQHPKLDIRIIFQVYRESYIKWAKKHNFKYAIGHVPKEWLC